MHNQEGERPVIGRRYRHFKGMEYLVIGIAKHSETLAEMVVYEAQYDNPRGKVWVRPLTMWSEWVEKPELGYNGPRFKIIAEE